MNDKDPMMLLQLLTLAQKARELASRSGNHGKKIRLLLEALLRDGITVVTQRTLPLVFAGQVDLTKFACEIYIAENGENEFGVSLTVDRADREKFTIHIALRVEHLPTGMRDRQRLLEEIAHRLDYVHSMLSFSAPTDRHTVLFGSHTDDLTEEEINAHCDRLTRVFDQLLEGDFSHLEDSSVPLKIFELANGLDPRVAEAYQAMRGISLELALERERFCESPAVKQPSLTELFASVM